MKAEITYYAVARNADDKIEQLFVTVKDGKCSQRWTGFIYTSDKAAREDLLALNCRKAS